MPTGAHPLRTVRSEPNRPRHPSPRDSCARPGQVHTARPRPRREGRSWRGGCKGRGGAFAPGPPAPPIKSARGGRCLKFSASCGCGVFWRVFLSFFFSG
ncbi:unnamed protein product [Gulo gulo]|uniref:Uncharacterized protein n=1 Tax=Gulo gulo TaxID=48420 RepID=A0A9X9Q634_GULGU|nr:unnamed protein product [Gulo gulo]